MSDLNEPTVVHDDAAMQMFWVQLEAIAPLLKDPDTQEVMINAPDDIWVERRGQMEKTSLVTSSARVEAAIRALFTANKRKPSPILDARARGVRIAAALPPVATRGPAMAIRKHAPIVRRLSEYTADGSFDLPACIKEMDRDAGRPDAASVAAGGEGVEAFLKWMVARHSSFLVAGCTSSGKTTLLNALLAEIDGEDRVLTIEDTAELQVMTRNRVGFEVSERDGVSVRDLVKLSLRFRPDRIIVGEIRGAEAYDTLDALNTGHEGGTCTLHANSAYDALIRLESMLRMNPGTATQPLAAMRAQIARAFRFVIFANRIGGKRGPEEIVEVLGVSESGDYLCKTLFDKKKNKKGVTP